MSLKPGQEKCINTLDRALVVAAGAGSGKTFTLTKRIAHALESGYVDDIGQVLAITFTRKAAGELKSRIKTELRKKGLVEQALKVDEAWISTIHGMCARILRTHAIELGLDPAFTVLGDTDAQALMQRAVDIVLKQEKERGSESLDALFEEYAPRSWGFGGSSVESMVATIVGLASASPDGFDSVISIKAPDAGASARILASVLEMTEQLIDRAHQEKESPARDAWIQNAQDACSRCHDALMAGAVDERIVLSCLSGLSFSKNFGSKEYKAVVDDVRMAVARCVLDLRLALAAPFLDTLVSLSRKAADVLANLKAEAGLLDNNDLLVRAYLAVSEHPAIAAHYTNRFKLIMVDEFQDTDQMQVDMIKLLAGPDACRLCVVGDAQQSIYRFRGADVSVYRRHVAAVESNDCDAVIQLPDNFRSHPDVLALVDRTFAQPTMFAGEFMKLEPGRDEAKVEHPFAQGETRIFVQQTSIPWRGVTSATAIEHAAARIAERFAALRDAGHSAGEMAILLGRMTYSDAYAAALRAVDLKCVVVGGSVFARSTDVQLVASLLRFIASPHETHALYTVLASDVFGLDEADLLCLATAYDQNGIPYRRDLDSGLSAIVRMLEASVDTVQNISDKLARAVMLLKRAVLSARRGSIARTIRHILVQSGWLSRVEKLGGEGQARAANVYKALRIIDRIERETAAGPSQLAQRFEEELATSKEAPGALSTTGGEVVRIMTVHASKGLEFPIVAVADIADGSSRTSGLLSSCVDGKVYLSLDVGNTARSFEGAAKLDGQTMHALFVSKLGEDSDEGALAQAIKDARTLFDQRAALALYEELGEVEESKRLLYVAMTRAEEALVISFVGNRTKANPNAIPAGALGGLVSGLEKTGLGFSPGTSAYDFGGAARALVEHSALEADASVEEAEGAAIDSAAEDAPDQLEFELPCEPIGDESSAPVRPIKFTHQHTFSYSSIADNAHEGDALDRLLCVCEHECYGVSALDEGAEANTWETGVPDDVFDVEDDAWVAVNARVSDSDKATSLGTAFHRLAQLACEQRSQFEGRLVCPDEERIAALSQTCTLDNQARYRLKSALDRWFASDIAHKAEAYADLKAETPFFVRIDNEAAPSAFRPAYLEGEIDLLGLAPDGLDALVVDYKTGGHETETADVLYRKHVLQASCYAYALMRQGVERIEVWFVRVEQGRADNPSQPQCVRYSFGACDAALLEQAICACLPRA